MVNKRHPRMVERKIMAKRIKKVKFTPKPKKTLVPAPNWEKLQKASTEEKRLDAWKDCEQFVHAEVTDKEYLHSMKKWVRGSDWNMAEQSAILPDAFMLPFAKHGWKAIRLGFMPENVERSKSFLKASKNYQESPDPALRSQYRVMETYLYNLNQYVKMGVWLDSHYGAKREYKQVAACVAPAYHADGTQKRTIGIYYLDVGDVWTKEMEGYYNDQT